MAYTKLFYHAIWSTIHRGPIITPDIENQIHSYITIKALNLGGIVYAINGTSDHVHLAVSIAPPISISKLIGQIKAVASVRINQLGLCDRKFYCKHPVQYLHLENQSFPALLDMSKIKKIIMRRDVLGIP